MLLNKRFKSLMRISLMLHLKKIHYYYNFKKLKHRKLNLNKQISKKLRVSISNKLNYKRIPIKH